MTPIEIPVATLPWKIVIDAMCLLFAGPVLWWTIPKFLVFLRVVSGREAAEPGTRAIHIVLGLLIYGFLFLLAGIPTAIMLEMTTAPPTVITDSGVTGGGGVLTPRAAIVWSEVQTVNCTARRDRTVSSISVQAGNKRVDIGSTGIYDLQPALGVIHQHLPPGMARPCSIPTRT